MSSSEPEPDQIKDTKVLAIASHVAYGYVGNTMATFVMQRLGCEVAAINTVHFSNHTGYKQFKGTKTPAPEIQELYDGLKASFLVDFDVLLSGYIPSIESLRTVGAIARDLRDQSRMRPGSFFWVLDPVMGDQGHLYVSEKLVAGYKEIVREADLLLPNQFELEVLTGIKVTTETEGAKLDIIAEAIQALHRDHGTKHVVVTSVRVAGNRNMLCVVGSSANSNGHGRIFTVDVPILDCFFSGTGDMFAALMVGRLRQACQEAGTLDRHGWMSDDAVSAANLPLAIATCQVLSSMQMILEKTMTDRNKEMDRWIEGSDTSTGAMDTEDQDKEPTRKHLAATKAAEVRVVRYARDLVLPEARYRAEGLDMQ